jgi:hypothetical protein
MVASMIVNFELPWRNCADYSVDELFSMPSIDQSSHCCESRFSAGERAKF